MALSNSSCNVGELYELKFITGKRYIGITTVGIRKRYMRHRNYANNGSNAIVHKAWRKYGEPSVRILAIAEKDYLLELEKRAISIFCVMHPDGYNMSAGGQGGVTAGSEIAKRISKTKKDRKQGPSAETIAAVIKSNTGKKHTKETKEKLSKARTGRIFTEETRLKISESNKGKKRSDAAVENNRMSHIGLKQSQETIEKRRQKMIGNRWADESYANGWKTRREKLSKQLESA